MASALRAQAKDLRRSSRSPEAATTASQLDSCVALFERLPSVPPFRLDSSWPSNSEDLQRALFSAKVAPLLLFGEMIKQTPNTFQSRLRPLPTHSLPAMLRVVRGELDRREGRLGPSRYLIAVPPDVMQLSPGIAAILATEAVSACRKAQDDLDECLKKSLSWRDIVYARPGE
jgi:hypothetical protein